MRSSWKVIFDPLFLKVTRYIVGGSTVLGGLWGYVHDLSKKPDPIDNLATLFLGSAGGCVVGMAHPILVPVALPVLSVLYPLYVKILSVYFVHY
jgi:hypothetical protein